MGQRAWLAVVLWTLCGGAAWADRDLLGADGLPPLPGGWRLTNGVLQVSAQGDARRARMAELPAATSGQVSLTWRVTAGADLRVGLVCLTAPETGWFAQLRGDGYYWLGQLVAGRAQSRLSGMVPAGAPGQPLTLKLAWQPGRQTTWLGATPLTLPSAAAPPVNGIALWASGTGSAEVTSLVLGEPSVTPPPVRPPDPTPPTPVTPPTTPPRLSPGTGPDPAPSAPADGQAQPAGVDQIKPDAPDLPPPTALPDGPGAAVIDPGGQPNPILPDPSRPPAPDVPTPIQPGGVAAPLPPAAAKVLFEDNFDPPRHQWNRDAFRGIEQGGLRLRSESGYQLSGFPFDFGALRYSATVRSLSADGGTYGLVARLQRDGGSGYLCVIRDPDQWAIARVDRGAFTLLKRGTVALAAGEHRLTATCLGDQISFVVDGQRLGEASDATYATGGVGVWVDNQRSALFDNLLVTEAGADQEIAVINPVDPGAPPVALTLPFEERFAAPRMGWQQDGQRELREGALWLTSEPGRYVVSGVAEQRYTDYLLSAECEPVDGAAEGRFGLMARLQADGGSGYLLACRPDGSFVVMRLDAGGAELLSRGAVALSPGVQRLWARCAGTSLVFGINATELARVQDTTYGSGGFGVYADHGAQARFLSIRAEALP